VIYLVDSNVEKNVPGESPQGLNQVELMKQMVGTWKLESVKDTTIYFDFKPYGTGLEGTLKWMNKGKMVTEAKQLWGYDSKIDKFTISMIVKGTDMEIIVKNYIKKVVNTGDVGIISQLISSDYVEIYSSKRAQSYNLPVVTRLILVASGTISGDGKG